MLPGTFVPGGLELTGLVKPPSKPWSLVTWFAAKLIELTPPDISRVLSLMAFPPGGAKPEGTSQRRTLEHSALIVHARLGAPFKNSLPGVCVAS